MIVVYIRRPLLWMQAQVSTSSEVYVVRSRAARCVWRRRPACRSEGSKWGALEVRSSERSSLLSSTSTLSIATNGEAAALELPTPRPVPKANRRRHTLALTRASGFDDGFGAQLQRLLGVYAICQEYGYDYVHTPLAAIEYQGLSSLLSGCNSDSFVTSCNERVAACLQSHVCRSAEFSRTIDADLPLDKLKALRSVAKRSGDRVLVRYQFPYVISDAHVSVYRHVRGLWPTRLPKHCAAFTIGLHVRRGELYVVDSDRMLPNAYYIDMARAAVRACKARHVPYRLELYSEVPQATTTVRRFANGKTLAEPVTLSPAANALSDFDVFAPRLERFLDEPLLDTFDRMVNCDLLIASRSSLSACASYLKDSGATLYHPFWHSMLDTDIPCDAPDLDRRILACVDTVWPRTS